MIRHISDVLPKFVPILLAFVWVSLIMTGMVTLRKYESTPGSVTVNPVFWPVASAVPRTTEDALVLFVHPRCPCSRATIGELALLIAQCDKHLKTYVLFYRPKGTAFGWERTDLWQSASVIPGAHVLCDVDGVEARRFHVVTSGHALLYDANGRLLFSGGITSARGHSGDNVGRSAIIASIRTGRSVIAKTPVFGCSLLGSLERTIGEKKD